MARSCPRCGAGVGPEAQFCAACGERLPSPAAAFSVHSAAGSSPSTRNSAAILKVIVGVLVVGVLAVMVAIGTFGYRGYHAVKEAFSGDQTTARTSAAKRRAQARPAFRPEPCAPLVPTQSNQEELANYRRAKIPLIPGLILVHSWASRTGDREEVTRVVSVDSAGVRISRSGLSQNNRPLTTTRTICQNDLLYARTYVTEMALYLPETIHGSTNFSLSRGLFKALKAGKAPFFEYEQGIPTTDSNGKPSQSYPGSLTRVEAEAVPLPVIVNDQRVELPTIHARGDIGTSQAEIYVVDDLFDPITLRYRMQSLRFGLDVVKISFPVEKPQLEQQLADRGRAEIYGIYFDFASAVIRPESGLVLKEIADTLTHNPSWKLRVEGHTDNIGGNAYNLELSRSRAAAVEKALVEDYHIAPQRLSAAGFGASRPKESNDTLVGRARNRRVELVRE